MKNFPDIECPINPLEKILSDPDLDQDIDPDNKQNPAFKFFGFGQKTGTGS